MNKKSASEPGRTAPPPPPGGAAPRPIQCPQCRGGRIQEIVYGYPTPATLAAAARGETVLGGCVSEPGQPEWNCATCGHQWFEGDEEAQRELEEMLEYVRRRYGQNQKST